MNDPLNAGSIAMGLVGGLALFLFGMEQMTDALKSFAGGGMKTLLAKMTTNRVRSAFTGAFVTAVIQSSSVTTVLLVGFISAGLMTLTQSIGVIMGANIGSTVTAQIIAFRVTQYGLLMIAVGFGLRLVPNREAINFAGSLLLGLGLIFFGMEMMSEATRPLRTYQPFIDLIGRMDNPVLGILVGAVFTGLVQSSAATTGIVIVLAGQGVMTLEAGIALAFGANIGTCVTAVLASIGKPREAVQAAVAHILFNVLGVLIWVMYIDRLGGFVRWVSPSSPELEAAARLAAETPRQIANAHTVFNVANTLLFLWFTGPFAKLVTYLVPIRPVAEADTVRPKYLDLVFLQAPELALDRVRMELGRMGEYAAKMVRKAPPVVNVGTKRDLIAVADMDDDVDALHEGIITYLGRLSQERLNEAQTEQLQVCMEVANYIENIGDTVETNLVGLGLERIQRELTISHSTRQILHPLYDKVCWSVENAIAAFVEQNAELAREVGGSKLEIDGLVGEAHSHLTLRLAADEPNRPAAFRTETDIIENLKRVYYFANRIAKKVDQSPG